MSFRMLLSTLLSLLALEATIAFHHPLTTNQRHSSQRQSFFSQPENYRRLATTTSLRSESAEDGSSGGLMSMGDSIKSQLASAFSALDETDQYDAVLTGLCAKILDQPSEDLAQVSEALQDPIQLMEEMNARRIKAGSRSLMALIDAAVTSQDAKLVGKILSLGARNGRIALFGNLQTDFLPLPTARMSKVRCPDGVTRTRGERLDLLPDIPTDEREKEITSALIVGSILAFCGTVNVLGMDEISPATNFVWFLILTVGALDNFYDIIKFAVKNIARDKLGDLPKELPLSLGSGQVSGTVVKGFNRVLKVDTERECECEAASFFMAYSLGLPCFSFRPNALEAAVLVAESNQSNNDLDPLLTNTGIMKVLVWLMAPVAMESIKHPELIHSDPREAEGFLSRLQRSNLIDNDALWWLQEGPEEVEDMLKWAYTEADLMLRTNMDKVTEISKRLTGGAATVADCVAATEEW
ncbi:unnamed protein product [Cylindrotheca closterium]|uniref:Uncharacterized protein n=1 Tax=Cylindrotheca closterium TaxID=2856 RepID=A0AAD2GAW4_9STRA|nr:unnamed protein product [Cylindrotheca closterium]